MGHAQAALSGRHLADQQRVRRVHEAVQVVLLYSGHKRSRHTSSRLGDAMLGRMQA